MEHRTSDKNGQMTVLSPKKPLGSGAASVIKGGNRAFAALTSSI